MCTETISSMYERYWPSFGDLETKENSKLRLFLIVIPFIGIPIIAATVKKYDNLNLVKTVTVTLKDRISLAKYVTTNFALTGALLISLYAKGVFASLFFPVSGAVLLGYSLVLTALIIKEQKQGAK